LFSQVGLSRSTTGCVAACLFREFQLTASYEGLVETVPGVNTALLRMDNYQVCNNSFLLAGETFFSAVCNVKNVKICT
jgi:hypothetical protein